MAFQMHVKKANGTAPAAGKKNILEDIRFFIVLMLIAFIGLVVLIVFGVRSNMELKTKIETQKTTYQKSQISIANLRALQARSAEFEAQRTAYFSMLPERQDVQAVMIDMERRAEEKRCTLTNLTFGGAAAIGTDKNQTAAPTVSSAGVRELQVFLSLEGSYADIMALCNSLVTDPELMRIDAITLTPISGEGKQKAEITLVKFSRQ